MEGRAGRSRDVMSLKGGKRPLPSFRTLRGRARIEAELARLRSGERLRRGLTI
jgi:hypothetical protein